MARLQWKIMNLPSRLLQQLHNLLVWLKLLRKTLFYNHFTSFTVALETVVEPMFWSVERFAKYLGPIFVTLVVCLTTSVVVIFYICLLPHVYEQSLSKTVFHLIFGHWLLMNIVFNYVLAAFTDPGSPPLEIPETVSICKKCISPKPPRAHHCSVCNRCILKMDHHCPWLNNCIGFFNHRYFFQFCCYMFFGTVYVCVTGVDLFKQHFYGDKEYPFPGALYPLNLAYEIIYGNNEKHYIEGGNLAAKPHKDDLELNYNQQPYHSAVVYEFIICSAVAVALLLLIMWHMKMISSGETNIEVHINKKETQRLKKKGLVYKNPYHYGFIKNWRNFFALTEERSFWRCVLLPSLHKPIGNGLSFPRAVYKFDSEKGLQLL